MTDPPTSPLELVSFTTPPVQEIAFSIQLLSAQLSLENMVDFGRALSPSFPVQQLQPALPRMMEPGLRSISVTVGAPLPRLWFVSEDGLRLVQVQEDRIAFNWRGLGRDAPYPRYNKLRAEFDVYLELLGEVVPELEGNGLRADFCELTYVNELEVAAPSGAHPPLDAILRVAQSLRDAEFLPHTDTAEWNGRWTIRDAHGAPAGWLTASAEPALRQRDQRPIYLLTMTGVLPGQVAGKEVVFEQLDLAHEWIVRGFADLTTKEMHDRWGRTR
jgi:uncharacterized protein (TIGR04255 family)